MNSESMTTIRVAPKAVYNGFLLSHDVEISGYISVFLGKNGAGKSRFFQSLKNNQTQVELNGVVLDFNTEISLLTPEQLMPSFGVNHDQNSLNKNIDNTIRAYQSYRHLVDLPYEPTHDGFGVGRVSPLPRYSQIYRLANFIAQRIGKKPSELSEDDINLNYAEVASGTLGSHDIAGIFNRYCKKFNDNRFNRFRKEEDGEDVPCLSDDDFLRRFGSPPWDEINRILNSIFGGKFHFPAPENIRSKVYDHQTPLLESDNRVVNVSELSSGEKTLLWLSLSLFNSQYNERDLLRAPKLLLLDEPDAFLHPKMVESMYRIFEEFHAAFGTIFWVITHSPTTVALAPSGSLHIVHATNVEPIDKDAAVAELLDGVPQIAILPENRRNVYVESHYDVAIYEDLFTFLRKRSARVNGKISVNFFAAGPKMPEAHLADVARKILDVKDEALLQDFVTAINGSSNCSQVYAATQSLNKAGSIGIRGLVDWDGKNKSADGVFVVGEGDFYAIENIILDPICLILQLNIIDPVKYGIDRYSGGEFSWLDWIKDPQLLQKSLDAFLFENFNFSNEKDVTVGYASGFVLKSDSRYTKMNGHDLETVLWSKFPEFNRIARRNCDGELKRAISRKIMINLTDGHLIPKVVEDAFVLLQQ